MIILFIWVVIVPPSFFIAQNYFPSGALDWENLAFLGAILFVTMILPLHIQHINISLERWITFTVFLQYGVFAELVIMQLAVIILILSTKSPVPFLH